jgi:hypothetical protein
MEFCYCPQRGHNMMGVRFPRLAPEVIDILLLRSKVDSHKYFTHSPLWNLCVRCGRIFGTHFLR